MIRFLKKRSAKAGLPPGTLVHIGEEKVAAAQVRLFDFTTESIEERTVEDLDSLAAYKGKSTTTWVNIDGVSDTATIERVGQFFGLHHLTIEDVVNTDQRPKVEEFEEYIFVVLRMLRYDEGEGEVLAEQLSLVLGKDFVISFQEQPGDNFDLIRERLRTGKGRVRTNAADYLLYRLLDAVVDGYFVVMERFGERVESLEEGLMDHPEPETARVIMDLRRELLLLRKAVGPLREVLNELGRAESELVTKETAIYLRDVYDHAIRVVETIDTFRDLVGGLRDTYMTLISNRMNEVMKVLTIIATIFIPITFIAGVYGMNFEVMPELKWRWSYPILILVMLGTIAGMLGFFRKKRWL